MARMLPIKPNERFQHFHTGNYFFFERIYNSMVPGNLEFLKTILVVAVFSYASFFGSILIELSFLTDEEHQFKNNCPDSIHKNQTVYGINLQDVQLKRKDDIHQDPEWCRTFIHVITAFAVCVAVGWRWPRYLDSSKVMTWLSCFAIGASSLTVYNSFTESSLGFLILEFCNKVAYVLCTELLVSSLPKRMRELGMLMVTFLTAMAMAYFLLFWRMAGPQSLPIISACNWLVACVVGHWLGSESLQSMALYTKTEKLTSILDKMTRFCKTRISAIGIFDVIVYGSREPEPTDFPEALEVSASNPGLIRQLLFNGLLLFFTRSEMSHDMKYGPTHTLNMPFPMFFIFIYIGFGTLVFTMVLVKFGRRPTLEFSLCTLIIYYTITVVVPLERYDECQGKFLNYIGANMRTAILEKSFKAVTQQFLMLLWGGSIGMIHLCARLGLSEACPQIIRVFFAAISHSLIERMLFIPDAYIHFLESLGHVCAIYTIKICVCFAFLYSTLFIHELPQAVLTFNEVDMQHRIWREREARHQDKEIENDLKPPEDLPADPESRQPTHEELYP